jgi:PTH1 family peptidyl-tRNA hydrolase
VTGYVLGRFTPDEQKELDATITAAVDACLAILDKGITLAMNQVNTRR